MQRLSSFQKCGHLIHGNFFLSNLEVFHRFGENYKSTVPSKTNQKALGEVLIVRGIIYPVNV